MENRWSAHRGVGFARGPPPVFFSFASWIRIAIVYSKLCTQPQANKEAPRLRWHRGKGSAHNRAVGMGCSQGSSELDSERRRVQCVLQGKAMDRHVSSSSGSSWLTDCLVNNAFVVLVEVVPRTTEPIC